MSVCLNALYNKCVLFKLRNKKQSNILRLEHMNMKFTAIAKAIFVLGILTTSVMITENQSVNAKGKYEKMNRLYDTNKLHQYYSGPSYELTNVSGQSQGYYDS